MQRPPGLPPTIRHTSRQVHYRDAIRKHGRVAVVIVLTVVAAVVAGSLLQAPRYRAAGLLEIRRESAGVVPVEALFTPERMADEDVQTEFGLLTSATLAERVVAQVGLPGHDGVARQEMVQEFRERLTVNPREGSRLVEVSFTAADPEFAARAVNSVLDNYLQLRMEDTQQSATWLTAQLDMARNKLEDSERGAHAYEREHGFDVPTAADAEPVSTGVLRQLHEQLVQAQSERYTKQAAYEAARGEGPTRTLDSPVIERVAVRIAELRQEEAKLGALFHSGYPRVKEVKDQIAELLRIADDESNVAVGRARREYETARRREALLRGRLDEQQLAATALGDRRPSHDALTREVDTNRRFYTALDERLKAVAASAALKAANVGIVDRATPPVAPDNAPLALNLSMGLLLGLVLAVSTGVAREHLDSSVRTSAEIYDVTGAPALAAIPAIAIGSGRGHKWGRGRLRRADPHPILGRPNGPVALLDGAVSAEGAQWWRIDQDGDQRSPVAEAFAALRTAVLIRRQTEGAPSRVLLVTSPEPGDGKTTVAVNLAVSLARLKHRVLLIDANLRHPCVHHVLQLGNHGEFAACLTGEVNWRDVVRPSAVPGLDVLVGSTPQTSPAELLSLPGMGRIVKEALTNYEFVLVDSPTLSEYPADVHLLAAVADSVVLTVRSGSTPREAIVHAMSQLDRVIGIVLNGSEDHNASRV